MKRLKALIKIWKDSTELMRLRIHLDDVEHGLYSASDQYRLGYKDGKAIMMAEYERPGGLKPENIRLKMKINAAYLEAAKEGDPLQTVLNMLDVLKT